MEVFLDSVLMSVAVVLALFPRLWRWQYQQAKSAERREIEANLRQLRQERNLLALSVQQTREYVQDLGHGKAQRAAPDELAEFQARQEGETP